jgi:hypothetical protein
MSTIPTKLAELTHLLKLAGAPNPEAWARSELQEDIPQLARFMFLRQAWRCVVADDDTTWIGKQVAASKHKSQSPGASLGPALERCLATGCSARDLLTVARTAQWQLLHQICYLLSDPSIEEPELQHVAWALVEVDQQEHRGREIGCLHESVLETDPTGREMCPTSSVKV